MKSSPSVVRGVLLVAFALLITGGAFLESQRRDLDRNLKDAAGRANDLDRALGKERESREKLESDARSREIRLRETRAAAETWETRAHHLGRELEKSRDEIAGFRDKIADASRINDELREELLSLRTDNRARAIEAELAAARRRIGELEDAIAESSRGLRAAGPIDPGYVHAFDPSTGLLVAEFNGTPERLTGNHVLLMRTGRPIARGRIDKVQDGLSLIQLLPGSVVDPPSPGDRAVIMD